MKQSAKELAVVVLSIALVMAAVIAAVGGMSAAANSIQRRSREIDEQKKMQDEASEAAADTQGAVPTLSSTKVGWGIGPSKNEMGQPNDAVSAEQKYADMGGHFLIGRDKTIYLTFDCGYENGFTAPILDTLREKGVQATFFITGDYLDEAPDLVARMLQEGHVVGNHTEKHPSLPDVSSARAETEVNTLHRRMKEMFGYEMQQFRFPMGEFSEQTLAQLKRLGYESLFWSFAYKDWLPAEQPSPAAALQKMTDALHPALCICCTR
ncbi:MAG: polysaccharide deacetylase family protein [Oscillospiraceae bacterium]|nr:polysaccharide deacetylase family protein [Oscillospiraceae bacterium]